MKGHLTVFSLIAMFITTLFIQPVQASGWELLGEKQVSRRTEADTIFVGAREGVFRKIQFKVRGADVDFKRAIIHYRNGQTREIAMKGLVRKNNSTRQIDLPGKARAIEKVSFWYQTQGKGRAQATVLLWGKEA